MTVNPIQCASRIVAMMRDGQFRQVTSSFSAPLLAAVSADTLRDVWADQLRTHGPVTALREPTAESMPQGLTRVSTPVVSERGAFAVVMSVDSGGVIQGLRLAPLTIAGWTAPPYATPAKFVEREIQLEAAGRVVGGTIGLPRESGPRPGVVLLSGGGPFDRDETAGVNKPLKDIAWGLASRGIATFRFDKPSYRDPGLPSSIGYTMTEEYVPCAVAAIETLRREPAVDPARIFVLGHSMGGKVAPRVAAAEPMVAGLIIMAGDTQPMQRSAVRVMEYLASLNPTEAARTMVENVKRQAALVESPDLEPSTPPALLPLGLSGSYWLDLRSYDPAATAATLGKPMLILQGGRDYQVTVADDLSGWQAALANAAGVSIRVYEADDHLFFPGTGRSTPADYTAPQHVDPAVIEDIATWIGRGGDQR
jgi:dienelactone hydrolase